MKKRSQTKMMQHKHSCVQCGQDMKYVFEDGCPLEVRKCYICISKDCANYALLAMPQEFMP